MGPKFPTNLLSDLSSLTQSTSAIISRTQACPVLESHTDTGTGDQGRGSPPPQNPPWAHWNRSRTCIYWTISTKHWLGDNARFVSWNGLEPPQYSLLLCSPVCHPILRAAESPGPCLSPAGQGYPTTSPWGLVRAQMGAGRKNEAYLLCTPLCLRGSGKTLSTYGRVWLFHG